jgi:hypothetical protein
MHLYHRYLVPMLLDAAQHRERLGETFKAESVLGELELRKADDEWEKVGVRTARPVQHTWRDGDEMSFSSADDPSTCQASFTATAYMLNPADATAKSQGGKS